MVVDADLSRKFIQLNGEQLNGRGLVGSFFSEEGVPVPVITIPINV